MGMGKIHHDALPGALCGFLGQFGRKRRACWSLGTGVMPASLAGDSDRRGDGCVAMTDGLNSV